MTEENKNSRELGMAFMYTGPRKPWKCPHCKAMNTDQDEKCRKCKKPKEISNNEEKKE